jgi:AcrR family transcriptional regulator
MARDTRKRILVASLLLFNEHGVPRTTINEIADEMDISPGNLHYHFRKKADIVDGLTAEFQADARTVLDPPQSDQLTLDDFWLFLHLLLEFTTAYRYMLTDTDALIADYPKVGRALGHFARGLTAAFEIYLLGLARGRLLNVDVQGAKSVGRNLAVIALMSERFDELSGAKQGADDAALNVARSILGLLRPLASAEAVRQLDELATHYRE